MGINIHDAPQVIHNNIVDSVLLTLQDNAKLLCLGGDHSISYPILEAYAKKFSSINILHFDAHPDLYHNFQDNP